MSRITPQHRQRTCSITTRQAISNSRKIPRAATYKPHRLLNHQSPHHQNYRKISRAYFLKNKAGLIQRSGFCSRHQSLITWVTFRPPYHCIISLSTQLMQQSKRNRSWLCVYNLQMRTVFEIEHSILGSTIAELKLDSINVINRKHYPTNPTDANNHPQCSIGSANCNSTEEKEKEESAKRKETETQGWWN